MPGIGSTLLGLALASLLRLPGGLEEGPSAWVGQLDLGAGRRSPYLLRVEPNAAGGGAAASLDRLDQIGPAGRARSAEVGPDSVAVFFEGPGGPAWVLALELVGDALEGVAEIGEDATQGRPATFVRMALPSPEELARVAGDYEDEAGARLHLGVDPDGFLVAHLPAEARMQMLFPSGEARLFGGASPTWSPPVSVEVRRVEEGLAWTEHGATRVFHRRDVRREPLLLHEDELVLGALRMPLARLPAGTFRMGQQGTPAEVREALGMGTPPGSDPAPDPVRPTTLSRAFLLSRVELTRDWFAAFVEETGHMTDAERAGLGRSWNGNGFDLVPGLTWRGSGDDASAEDLPVVQVSWNDATAFCAWLSARLGRVARLPTEAEWEYACAAGTRTLFSCGDATDLLSEHAWFADNASAPHAVATRRPNPWGLFDLHGNVWEWCADAWEPIHAAPATDPVGPEWGPTRVLRGGSWLNGAWSLRTAYRAHDPATLAEPHIGFRVVVETE